MQRAHALGNPADGLIHAQHNRSHPDRGKRWAEGLSGESLGEIEFMLPSRHGQAAREVCQPVWAQRVALSDGQGGRRWITCLIAKEIDVPEGVKPIEWRLLTNREATSFEAVAELIDGYRARGEIETFFHVLKNGRRVEALQLATIGQLERALAVYRGRGDGIVSCGSAERILIWTRVRS